ncbi:MAG: SDR family NAD(P)-dependent oxidoreductase [Treponema sp.]|jgi:short-subunit dehydrogenase|nr:SDR family NAD(P)-dependent oxidoreductase [Treponema sp.]
METTLPWVLITGASAGIGREIAHVLAGKGWNLVLTALSQEKLEVLCNELSEAYGVEAIPFMADLSFEDSAEQLYEDFRGLRDKRGKVINITFLVNSAGIVLFGESVELQEKAVPMLCVNVITPTVLCALFGDDMRRRDGGTILNIGSLAANQPAPLFASYGASKTYIRNYSLALRQELAPFGVSVTCVQAGYIRTESDEKGGVKDERDRRFSHRNGTSARRAAEIAVRAALAGRSSVTIGVFNAFITWISKVVPLTIRATILSISLSIVNRKRISFKNNIRRRRPRRPGNTKR